MSSRAHLASGTAFIAGSPRTPGPLHLRSAPPSRDHRDLGVGVVDQGRRRVLVPAQVNARVSAACCNAVNREPAIHRHLGEQCVSTHRRPLARPPSRTPARRGAASRWPGTPSSAVPARDGSKYPARSRGGRGGCDRPRDVGDDVRPGSAPRQDRSRCGQQLRRPVPPATTEIGPHGVGDAPSTRSTPITRRPPPRCGHRHPHAWFRPPTPGRGRRTQRSSVRLRAGWARRPRQHTVSDSGRRVRASHIEPGIDERWSGRSCRGIDEPASAGRSPNGSRRSRRSSREAT